MHNRRHTTSHRAPPALNLAQQEELRATLAAAVARRERWTGSDVAAWISERIGRPVAYSLGYAYLQRLKDSQQLPRPQHVQADLAAQEAFKKREGRCCVRSRPRFRMRRWNCGRQTNIASASSRSCDGSGRPVANAPLRRSSIATPGAISSASFIRRLVGPCFIWPRPQASRCLKPNAPPLLVKRERPPASKLSWSSIERDGMPPSGCACPTTSTCSSCRRIRQNSSLLSTYGR